LINGNRASGLQWDESKLMEAYPGTSEIAVADINRCPLSCRDRGQSGRPRGPDL